MGAPMVAFARIDDRSIELHCSIYEPDSVVVLDPTLVNIVYVFGGLREGGSMLINSSRPLDLKRSFYRVPASKIAMKILGKDITNTAMIWALLKVEPVIKLDALSGVIGDRFSGKLAELNREVVRAAYRGVERA